jgi:2-polyprenyl-3-methyl-5-hydroxy-6-metoxy-1,4-benzoquinol methylase
MTQSQNVPLILALSMVKNEQDIIEPFVRHTTNFVDYHIILDNGSLDATRAILGNLMREIDGVIVTTSSEFGYTQSERMTKLLRSCQTTFFANYVIFLDADEFISCESRAEFEQYLATIPSGGYGRIPWRTHVLHPADAERPRDDPPRSMPWQRANEHPRENIVLRLDGRYYHDLKIAQGNHSAASETGRDIPSVALTGLKLDHFPIRSEAQFVAKSIIGWIAYLAMDPEAAKKGEGYHWHLNFDLASRGESVTYEQICDLSFRYDQPHKTTIDWETDVVRGWAPDDYVRRYSNGLFMSPLSMIARTWQSTLERREPLLVIKRKETVSSDASTGAADCDSDADWHWNNPFADLAPFVYISEKHKPTSLLDVGCGIGAYATLFKNTGASRVLGVDGIPLSATMLGADEYREVDLTQPLALGQMFDIVMCLEAVEHLPYHESLALLECLSRHASGLVVFSAAEPGQPGHGHIKCLPIEQWLRRWEVLGWVPVLAETLAMRALSTLSWFKRGLVVLKKGSGVEGEAVIQTLSRIGSRPFAWYHSAPGIRYEVLSEDVPAPPAGYSV